MSRTLLLCDCAASQSIDADALEMATGLPCSRMHSALCTDEIGAAAKAIETGEAIICCGQETRTFEDLAAELGADSPACIDLRDRAGWSDDPSSKHPKMAALLAEASLPVPSEKTRDVISEGLCLIIGAADAALPAAEKLAPTLGVTVLLTDDGDPPESRAYDAIRGRIVQATGALGGFDLRLDALQQVNPAGRGPLRWTAPRDGGQTQCDIILDLSGSTPMFPAPQKREGYLRADPGSLPAVADAVFEAAQLIGTFEKPLYVALEPHLCAHSRAGQTGCSKCLEICPTGAIVPDGDHVSVDPMICAGCGACAAVCPSGAISYDAPPPDMTFRRIQTLASAYLRAGGTTPRLLVHDADFGAEMIRLAARHGAGLPADVIPLEVAALSGFGHAEILAALASGFGAVQILLAPRTERDALDREVPLARAMAGGAPVEMLDPEEPDALCAALYDTTPARGVAEPVLPMGSRRQVTRLAAKALTPGDETLPLPDGAPYGTVRVDTEACTLCLSCVSLCPSGALMDNADLPQLRFQEDACLQCGICATICPESAITLEPRMTVADSAMSQIVLHEEEPCACIECGALFGSKSTIDRILEKLAGKHSMFATSEAARTIQMCEDCRINAQFKSSDNPFAAGDRPRVRTSEDYLSGRKDH
ncbi:4Fe-4S binding protein [Roseovarius tibetensis]|uniref:4Fe-4S binding protein n=1 Tax=Roseovarius tibetensis TaxID=2685897 RepID=UPI003D7F2C2C